MTRLTAIPSRVLVGPTASGKTDVVHCVIERLGRGGVLSADAMMVYREMDIGTAKPTPTDRKGVAYAGIDLADPDQTFSVHDYLLAVETEMASQGGDRSDWLVCGGTGLYVQSVLQGLDPSPGADPAIRAEAEKVMQAGGLEALIAWCTALCPDATDLLPESDRRNPRRWIRAVERASSAGAGSRPAPPAPCSGNIVGLRRERDDLERRIEKRVGWMYKSGMVDEASGLRDRYAALSVTAKKAIGYAEAFEVLDSTLSIAEARARTVIRTRQYAKRQMTWFRNKFETKWIDVKENDNPEAVAEKVIAAWEHHG